MDIPLRHEKALFKMQKLINDKIKLFLKCLKFKIFMQKLKNEINLLKVQIQLCCYFE